MKLANPSRLRPLLTPLGVIGLQQGTGSSGAGSYLPDDTSLRVFIVEGFSTTNGGTITLDATYNGEDGTNIEYTLTPTNPAATVGAVTMDPLPLSGSYNTAFTFTVTAEDGVTTADYEVTLEVFVAASRYLRPDGTSYFLRPDGTSYFLRP